MVPGVVRQKFGCFAVGSDLMSGACVPGAAACLSYQAAICSSKQDQDLLRAVLMDVSVSNLQVGKVPLWLRHRLLVFDSEVVLSGCKADVRWLK